MKEFLQSIFKTTEERIKNPFIGAFMTSWMVFNWKPILFIIFSSKNIEDKINYIILNFSKEYFIFWFPLCTAFFYVLFLPYLNFMFDNLLKYSQDKRNEFIINKQKQNIENQKQLAIEELKLEEAKTEFRERNTHNKLVEDLQKRNIEFEQELINEKEQNRLLVEELKLQLSNRDKITNEEIKNFERRYSESRKEISELNSKLFEKDEQVQSLKLILHNNELNEKNVNKRIIRFENGLKVLEQFNGNEVVFYDLVTNEKYTDKEIKRLMEKYSYEKIL